MNRNSGGVEIAQLIALALIAVLLAVLVYCTIPPLPELPEPPVTCGTAFLGPDDFEGDWLPHSNISYTLGASSEFNGTIMLANIDSDLVEVVLGKNWSLAPPKNASEECHPVLILFGEQTNLQAFFLNTGNPVGGADAAYQEMMLLIPFTQHDIGGPLWHTSVVRMYLDDPTAKDIGNAYYAYNKELATFTDTGTVFSVFPGVPIAFQATYAGTGAFQNFNASTLTNLDEFKDILAMPLVGKAIIKNSSPTIEFDKCSYFDMVYAHDDGTHARVRQTSVQHDYFVAFVAPMTNWIGLLPLGNSTNGAIEVRNLGWKLMFPANAFCKYKQ